MRGASDGPPDATALSGLRAHFEEMPDFGGKRGQRHSVARYMTLAVAAWLTGYSGVSAFAEFASFSDDGQCEAVGAFLSRAWKIWTVPPASTFRRFFRNIPLDTLDGALRAWSAGAGDGGPVAMDGREIRGASKQFSEGREMAVVAVEHGCGTVPG